MPPFSFVARPSPGCGCAPGSGGPTSLPRPPGLGLVKVHTSDVGGKIDPGLYARPARRAPAQRIIDGRPRRASHKKGHNDYD